jgi:tight adherence protein B
VTAVTGPGSPLLPFAVACGLGAGVGGLLIISGLRSRDHSVGPRGPAAWWRSRRPAGPPGAAGRRALLAVAAAVVVALATRWPVGTVLAGLAAWSAPAALGRDRHSAAQIARIEAIAAWTEMLRDTTSAAAGLEQAIAATAPIAPAPIRDEVTALAARLRAGGRLAAELRVFADQLADPLADLVTAALVHAAAHHARRLGELLGSLAASARAQATMRQRVDAGRASLRTSVRIITTVTGVMAAGLILLNRGYLSPYDSPAGQLVLLAVGGVFAAGFILLQRMARNQQPARILAKHREFAQPAATVGAGAGRAARRET